MTGIHHGALTWEPPWKSGPFLPSHNGRSPNSRERNREVELEWIMSLPQGVADVITGFSAWIL